MSEKKRQKKVSWETTGSEVRSGARKYVHVIIQELEKLDAVSTIDAAKNIVMMGYAMGVIAGKLSDWGVEGYTLLLDGIKLSLDVEERKEKMLYAIWDKNGDLHSSEEGYRIEKGEIHD